jgi:asparagine synthase (glutamine-hydrolysing)
MCGITGFLSDGSLRRDDARALLQRMTDAIRHRGPDADGLWQSADGLVNLGHRRLSIIDLSPTGAQPMASVDGRFVLIFNGEIYNFLELRAELEAAGCRFRGTSDTEVLLQGIEQWGMKATLPRLNGMFAFALWDERERKLTLARDRFGEKPLYYAWHNGVLLFGSELKPMMLHPAFRREIEPAGLSRLIGFGYIGTPNSIFAGVRKLRGGCFLEAVPSKEPGTPQTYWDPQEMLAGRGTIAAAADEREIVDRLDVLLRKAVKKRMVSDVPLGAFLSGGIDSSTVVALMQAQSDRPVKTFTIGFWESGYNEAKDAANVARHLKTEHHEFYLSSSECIDTILRLPEIYDEPFADSSQIPTTLVSEFTRRHVTVALSGDAGDEFFGGYNRYFWSQRLWRTFQRFPLRARLLGRDLIKSLSSGTWEQVVSLGNHAVPRRYRVRGGGDKMHKMARILDAKTLDALYLELVSNPQWVGSAVSQYQSLASPFVAWQGITQQLGDVERMMFLDQMTYMTDDILCKVDRASMSTGLEARVPFLDNELTAFAWSLPMEIKIRGGVGKWPLRQVLKRYVPEKLFDRPKMGFGIPVGDWLRGPLREWAEDLLSEANLADGGRLDVKSVRSNWQEHLSGRRNLVHQLWSVLMFLSWKRKWIDGR